MRSALSVIGCESVWTAATYRGLLEELTENEADVAWAPPLICSKLEARGARVLLRAVRGGTSSYRSVLFARADRGLTLDTLAGRSAGWIDEKSMSGYVLPRALLRQHGVLPEKDLSKERFLGSFAACVVAVVERMVDVSATYASAAGASTARDGFVSLAGNRAPELAALGYSAECPNDGVVLSPALAEEEGDLFADGFARLLADAAPCRALAAALEVDGFEVPAAGSYLGLHDVEG